MYSFFQSIIHSVSTTVVGIFIAIGLVAPVVTQDLIVETATEIGVVDETSATTRVVGKISTNDGDSSENAFTDQKAVPVLPATLEIQSESVKATTSQTIYPVSKSMDGSESVTKQGDSDENTPQYVSVYTRESEHSIAPLIVTPGSGLIVSGHIDPRSYTTITPTITGLAQPTYTTGPPCTCLVDLVIYNEAGYEIFKKKKIPVVKNLWYATITAPLQEGRNKAELYVSDGSLLDVVTLYVEFNPDPDESIDNLGNALFQMYLGGAFSRTRATHDEALLNCKLNAEINPERYVRCYWKGKILYSNTGKSAAIDDLGLITASHNPTFIGTASGMEKIGLTIYSKNVTCGGCKIYGGDEPYYVDVINGHWSFTASTTPLFSGQYEIRITDAKNLGLATERIIITE